MAAWKSPMQIQIKCGKHGIITAICGGGHKGKLSALTRGVLL
jgi:hypothetical protein